MNIKLAPYYESYEGEGWYTFKPLNPTGRWKLETGPFYDGYKLFIEHKGWIFRRFICEDEIHFRPARTETIFSCHGDH